MNSSSTPLPTPDFAESLCRCPASGKIVIYAIAQSNFGYQAANSAVTSEARRTNIQRGCDRWQLKTHPGMSDKLAIGERADHACVPATD